MSADRPDDRQQAASPSALPEGLRVYAIGDIHGCFDLVHPLADAIAEDLRKSPPARAIEVFLGDYVDRGPQSRKVIDWLIAGTPPTGERICLMGNHEEMLLDVLRTPDGMAGWRMNGADSTLSSYGIAAPRTAGAAAHAELRRRFLAALPASHRAFLEALPRIFTLGGYVFVHAGLRPGRQLQDQDPQDLVWIREPFLSSDANFGRVVVHGHTPTEWPEIRPNRINIDTGAVFTGRLTCLVLEGASRRFLQTSPG